MRRAFNHVFDYEDINRTLFFGQYERIGSYFSGTELASTGLPEGREKEILESVKDKIPALFLRQPMPTPSMAARTRCARICARRCAF